MQQWSRRLVTSSKCLADRRCQQLRRVRISGWATLEEQRVASPDLSYWYQTGHGAMSDLSPLCAPLRTLTCRCSPALKNTLTMINEMCGPLSLVVAQGLHVFEVQNCQPQKARVRISMSALTPLQTNGPCRLCQCKTGSYHSLNAMTARYK